MWWSHWTKTKGERKLLCGVLGQNSGVFKGLPKLNGEWDAEVCTPRFKGFHYWPHINASGTSKKLCTTFFLNISDCMTEAVGNNFKQNTLYFILLGKKSWESFAIFRLLRKNAFPFFGNTFLRNVPTKKRDLYTRERALGQPARKGTGQLPQFVSSLTSYVRERTDRVTFSFQWNPCCLKRKREVKSPRARVLSTCSKTNVPPSLYSNSLAKDYPQLSQMFNLHVESTFLPVTCLVDVDILN